MDPKPKIIRTSTVPGSLNTFCKGLLTELKEEYEVVALSSPGEELDELGEREQVKTIAVPMQRQISPLKDLVSLWKIYRAFRREKPQMVHSMTPKAGLLCMMAGWMARVPVRVHTFTGLVFPTAKGLKQKMLIMTDRITCACATHIIPEGRGVKHDLLKYKITGKPLKVLGYGNVMGINLEHYRSETTARKKMEADDTFSFLFIGRLVGDKGINELAHAFCRLCKKYEQVRLVLVGGYESDLDPLKPDTLRLIQETPQIMAVGVQKDVRPWFETADALVFPSYREGFPNVVIEAGAMGVPSIVTDINGSREIIREGLNGRIIPSQDEESLYQAMEWMVNHPLACIEMAGRARKMVEDRYEQGFVRRCLKDFYRKILKP
ncbi:MAG: glycosyltransferase family 4 protein [Bacteroidales bacterium]|nr:glycosyltransferase family 4 protein [Candidatus Minthousia equi]